MNSHCFFYVILIYWSIALIDLVINWLIYRFIDLSIYFFLRGKSIKQFGSSGPVEYLFDQYSIKAHTFIFL